MTYFSIFPVFTDFGFSESKIVEDGSENSTNQQIEVNIT